MNNIPFKTDLVKMNTKHESVEASIGPIPIITIHGNAYIHFNDYIKSDTAKLKKIENLKKAIDELEIILKAGIFKYHRITGPNFTSVGQAVYEDVLNELKKIKEKYDLNGDD